MADRASSAYNRQCQPSIDRPRALYDQTPRRFSRCRRRARHRCAVGPTGAGPGPAPAAPQADAPPVVFRVDVDYVEADVYVADAQNNPVNDLTADDFEVTEDGKPQKVTAFSLVNIPIERAERPLFAAAPIEADVQTNDHTEGRIYLIVLDDLHTEFTRTPRVKAAMRRFFERSFGTNDMAAVVFTGRSNGSQDFTNNPRLLMSAVDKFVGRKLQSATIERLQNIRTDPATGGLRPGDDNQMMERSFNARNAMGSIRKLAEFMSNVRGRRKALLLVGEGVDYDIHEAVGLAGSTASAVLLDTHDAIASATRGNVSIYAIDPRGLTTGAEDLITVSSTMPEQGAGLNSLQNELRLSQDSLRVLAANTGGFAAVNQQRLQQRVRPHRAGEQPVLPARLLLEQLAPRRPLPQDPDSREAARPARRAGAQRLLRGARPPAGRRQAHGQSGDDARRSPARCRLPGCR